MISSTSIWKRIEVVDRYPILSVPRRYRPGAGASRALIPAESMGTRAISRPSGSIRTTKPGASAARRAGEILVTTGGTVSRPRTNTKVLTDWPWTGATGHSSSAPSPIGFAHLLHLATNGPGRRRVSCGRIR